MRVRWRTIHRGAPAALCAIFLLAGALPAAAAEGPRNGTLWVDVGADSEDALDARIELDVRTAGGTLVRLGTGGSYVPARGGDVEAGYVLAGAIAAVGRPLSAGASYEYWGQEHDLATHTVAATFTWNRQKTRVTLQPQARRIVHLRPVGGGGTVRDESVGRGLDAVGTLYAPGRWEWTLSGAVWGYNGASNTLAVGTLDTRTLDTRVTSDRVLLGAEAGFLERRLGAEAAYRLGRVRVGLEGDVIRYVDDLEPTYGAIASVYLPLLRSRAVELRVGRLVGGDVGPVTYGRLAVGYGW